ncbi:hypothetical protein EDC65_4489 [Stella humosa]|uniref:Uncharacterized protein n=1 Tax=Stella humosa TaxID=94 RepID=A0A3N1KYX4_9PROT|nr:hypothetical protein [Stella humosa]ROP83840.1 hypothetical protein EDC65_4489 [Stella humosa]BBK32899.1 hypothetical protein STHU_35330 [Stella humosa]
MPLPDLTLAAFEASLAEPQPPGGLGNALSALWWAGKGGWAMGEGWGHAHELAQADDGRSGAWVHAHLHRIEGDLSNAGYWYRHAGRPQSTAPLQDEWREISAALLDRQAP